MHRALKFGDFDLATYESVQVALPKLFEGPVTTGVNAFTHEWVTKPGPIIGRVDLSPEAMEEVRQLPPKSIVNVRMVGTERKYVIYRRNYKLNRLYLREAA